MESDFTLNPSSQPNLKPVSSEPTQVTPHSITKQKTVSIIGQQSIKQNPQKSPVETVWKHYNVKLNRESLQQALIQQSKPIQSSIHSLHSFFQFIQNLIFRVKFFCGFIQEEPPKNINFKILSQIVKAESEQSVCPSSLLLSYVHEQIKESNQIKEKEGVKTDEDLQLEERLKQATHLAKNIEILQNKKSLRANSKSLHTLIEQLKGRVEKLKPKEKCLIPGGWQQEGGKFSDALYEIECIGSNNFKIKVISLGEENKDYWIGEKDLQSDSIRYHPVMEFEDISLQQLKDSLEPLVHIQLPHLFQSKKKGNRGFIGEGLHAIRRLHADADNYDRKINLTPLGIMATLYGKSPKASEEKIFIKIPSSVTFSKTLLTFVKINTPANYKALKIKMELSAFFNCVNQDAQTVLRNPSLRNLIQVSARKLIHELEKNQSNIGLDAQCYEDIMRDLKDLLVVAQKLDLKNEKWEVPVFESSPFEQTFQLRTVTHPENLEVVNIKQAVLQAASFRDLNIPVVSSAGKVEASEAKISLEALKEQIQIIKNLYADEDYGTMEVLILDLARQLPPPIAGDHKKDFWKAIVQNAQWNEKIAHETIKEWNDSIFELSQLLFDFHQAQGSLLSPEIIIANANFLAIADRLMVLKSNYSFQNPFILNSNGQEATVYFDPKEIKNVLENDRYFRLISASQHRLAEDLLSYWNETEAKVDNKKRAPISLDSLDNFTEYVNLRFKYKGHKEIPDQTSPYLQAYIHDQACHDYDYIFNCYQKKFPLAPVEWKGLKDVFKEIEISSDGSNILPREVIQQRKMHLMMKGMLAHQHAFVLNDEKEVIAAGLRMVKEAGGNVNALSQQEMWQKLWKIQGDKVNAKFQNNKPSFNPKTKERGHIQWQVNEHGDFQLNPTGIIFSTVSFHKNWKKWQSDQNFYKESGKYLDAATEAIIQFEVGTKNEGEQILTQQTLINRARSREERILKSMQSGQSRLEQTFATFSEHPELLNSPSRQRLFELNIFKQGELLKKINEHPAFARELLSFSQNNLEIARGMKDISKALFFIQLRENLKDYVQLSNLQQVEKDKIINAFPSANDYKNLLGICVNDHERRAVYGASLSNYLQQIEKKTLDLDQLLPDEKVKVFNEILKGYFLYNSLNAGVAGKNPLEEKQIQYLMIRITPDLIKMFEDEKFTQGAMQEILGVLKLKTPHIDQISGKFPHISVHPFTINFNKGLVFENDKANGLLPIEILKNEIIERLFKDKKTGEIALSEDVQLEFKKDSQTGTEVTLYTFKQQPHLRLIQQAGKELVIQMRMSMEMESSSKRKWYELTSFQDPNKTAGKTSEHQLPGEISDLIMENFVWREIKNPAHFVVKDKNNDSFLYDVNLKGLENGWKLEKVKRFKDGLTLVNPWSNHQQLSSLTAIEDPSHIKAWADKRGSIKEFEFPRIKMPDGAPLAYRTKKVKHQKKEKTILEAVQFKGWDMPFESAPLIGKTPSGNLGVEILPHMFKNFQLLINSQTGAKKVFIPLQQATIKGLTVKEDQELDQSKFIKWTDQINLDHSANSLGNQCVLEFDVDPIKNALKTDDKQANLYLAYLFFASKRYEQALEFLTASETSLAMFSSHRNIYDWISTWPDKTAEGNAFKLKSVLALKAHDSKLEKASTSPEQDLLEAGQLSKLFSLYEVNKFQLPYGLHLTNKESETYNSVIHQTYLPAMVEKPLTQNRVSIPATSFQIDADHQNSRIDPFLLAKELFLEMDRTRTLSKDDFSLTSNKPFIQEFQALYQALLKAKLESDEFRQLKQFVELAQPPSKIAGGIQRILRGLINYKESLKDNPKREELQTELETKYNIPTDFKLPYFMFSRIGAVLGQEQSFEILANFLDVIDKKFTISSTGNDHLALQGIVSVNPKKNKLDKLPQREFAFDPTALKIKPDFHEGIHLFQTKMALKKQGVNFEKASPEQIISSLNRIRKLGQLAQDRRVSELKDRKSRLESYLNDHPVASVSVSKSKDAHLNISENVLKHVTPIEDFFDIQIIQRSSQEIEEHNKQVAGFFDEYIGGEVSPSLQRLALKYQDDTKAFIKGEKTKHITFKQDVHLAHLKEMVVTTFNLASKNRLKYEAKILKKIQLTNAKKDLSSVLESVPQRLIGLYIDQRMQEVNQLIGINLSQSEIHKLEALVQEWMVTTVQERMAKKGLDLIETIPDLQKASPEKLQELYQTLSPKRFYSIGNKESDLHFRELLSIEFFTGFILRENQVETIHTMLKDPNQVKQLGMGQGKSSVILPMLLHRLADGERLAIGVLPEWLYEIVSSDLDKSSRSLFGQDIFKFEFDRNTKMDREYLLNQYVTLASAISNRYAVVTTKTFLLSFRNKFLEMLAELENAKGIEQAILNEKLSLMANILALFKERGAAIADEVDTILDVRQELNYALGLPDKIKCKNWQMGLNVYRKILEIPDYSSKLRKNEQGLFTAQDIEIIQKKVASSFFKEWEEQFKKSKKPIDEELLIKYLQGKNDLGLNFKEGMPSFMRELKEKNTTLYHDICLLRQYFTQTLPTTLSHSGNVHYGRAWDGENTIPYKANNTPSEAEFGEEFERIGHFIQDYLQNGLSEKQVQTWITGLLTQISSEMYEHMTETGSMGMFEQMATYQRFHKEFPSVDLTQANQDPSIFSQFLKELNTSDETKLNFLGTWIFPSLEMANHQVSSNANDLVNMLGSFSGFTGTPWNTDTYNKKIHTEAAQAKGTDGKTIDLLVNMFDAGELSIRSVNLDAERPLGSILDAVPDFMNRYDSLIDAGYYLKGVDSEAVAEEIGQSKSKKNALVYVTQENEKVIQTLGRDDAQPLQNRKDVKMEDRLTYYDQAHTIGTDIPHTQTARAALTVGEKMYVKDFFQSLWRMRKIDKGQKVDLIVSNDVKELIKASRPSNHSDKASDVITIQDVILFCIKNQAEREAEDNLRAERQKLMGIVPDAMFWQLVEASRGGESISRLLTESVEGFNTKKELFKKYKSFLFKQISGDYDAMAKLATPEKTHKVLNDLRNQLIQTYEEVKGKLNLNIGNQYFQSELDEAIKELRTHKLLNTDKLTEKTEALSGGASGAKDSQVQTQRQQQQQISVETQSAIIPPDPAELWNNWTATNLDELWDISQTMEQANIGVPFLDADIRFTPNFAPQNAQTQDMSLIERLLGPKRIPVAQVLVMQDTRTGNWSTIMLDIKDYEEVVAKLMKPSANQPFKAAVFDVRPQKGSLLLRSTSALNTNPWNKKEMQVIREKFVKIKVFNRQMNFYDRQEVQALKNWIDKEKNMQEYYEVNLLTPSTQSVYVTSTLAKVFQAPLLTET